VGVGPDNHCSGDWPAAIVKYRPILSSEKILHKDYESKYSVEKKLLVVSHKGLITKMN
jgi:hypothetical protein